MEIDKVFSNDVDGVADNLFSAVKNSVSEIKAMQQRKAAENVQLVIQALKKIESDLQDKFDGVTTVIEKRVSTIKDGRDGLDGRNGRDGKDGRPGRDGAPGARGPAGVPGTNGRDGEDGVSVTDARIDFDGSLIISLSSGREINVGEVVAPDLAEKIKVITNGGGTSQSVLDSLASLQTQITALQNLGAVNYVGTWNASTNSPTITSGSGDKGDYYVVSVAGSTNIDGQTLWGVGDWIIFNGAVWQKVDGGSTGDFTNLSASGTVTFSGGTANGVAYLNGSKVLTTGSALTFDGSFYLGLTGAMKINSNGYKLRFYDATGATGYGYLYTDGTNFQFDSGNTQPLSFLINGTEGMRLTSTGLGIGTSSPNYVATLYKASLPVLQLANSTSGSTAGDGLLIYLNGANATISNEEAGSIGFQTSGTLRATLDSSGNLGLGVTPSAWNSDYRTMQFGATGLLYGRSGGEVAFGTNWYRDSGGTFRYLTSAAATYQAQAAGIHYWFNAASGTAGNAITFTQAMTLDASGNLLVGTTTANAKGYVYQGTAGNDTFWAENGSGNNVFRFKAASGFDNYFDFYAGTGSGSLIFRGAGTERARITSGGEVYIAGTTDQGAYNLQVNGTGVWGAGAYVNGSDERLKDNIQTLNDGLAVVSQLRPVTFQYKTEYSKDQSVQPGFIAQELQQAMAGKDYVDGVVQSGPEYLNVAYQNLIPILTKAIQELKAEFDAYKATHP